MPFASHKPSRWWLAAVSGVLVVCGLSFATSAWAATDTVSSLNDSGPGSLRATIATAHPGDTIAFARSLSGTISLTSGAIGLSFTKSPIA